MKFLAFAASAGLAAAAPLGLEALPDLCQGGQELTVTARVLSGSSDPSWTLSGVERGAFCFSAALLAKTDASPAPSGRVMGYKWFEVASASNPDDYLLVGKMPVLEAELLHMGRSHMKPAVFDHILEVIGAEDAVDTGYGPYDDDGDEAAAGAFDCKANAPVISPDHPQAWYDVKTDCEGCYQRSQLQSTVNCYGYANSHASTAFPEPGCGSGECFTEDNCDNLVAAAERDGLVWYGMDLPTDVPSNVTHYVAALIWPNANHHWIRMDSCPDDDCTGDWGYWSHKPGSTAVTNVDNNGDLVTDPATQDFSPWTDFCGYLSAQPSTVTIGPGTEP